MAEFFFCSSWVQQAQSVTIFYWWNAFFDLWIIVETWILLYKYKCPGNKTLGIWFCTCFFVLQNRDIKIILFPVWFHYPSPISLKVKMLIIKVMKKVMMVRMKFYGFSVMVATYGTTHHVSWGSVQQIFHQMTKGNNGFGAVLNWLLRLLFLYQHTHIGEQKYFLKIFFLWKKSEYHQFFCYYYPLTKYQQGPAPHWVSLLIF